MRPDAIRILYVDDEPVLLEVAKVYLERAGEFTVDTCSSARQVLARVDMKRYDAVISDYQMPEMDGLTFLKNLRSRGDEIPFIIFTGRGREEVVIEALNEGADFYLQKGGEPKAQFAELAHKIRHAITRKHAVSALIKSERDYRHLIDHAKEAIYVVQGGMLQMVNPRLVEMTGYSEQELTTLPMTTFIHPDDRDMIHDRYERRIRGELVPSRYNFRLFRKDKTIRWAELSAVVISWKERPAVLVFLTDITERKLTEDALKESEERYRHYFKTTLDSVFITTPEGTWIDFNDALVEMFGYQSRDEMYQVPVPSIYAHPEERAIFLQQVIREGYVKERPLQFRKRDGTFFDSLITIVPLKNPDGAVKAFIGTFRDITSHKRAESALRECEAKFRCLVKYSPEAILLLDPEGRIMFANAAAARMMAIDNCADLAGRSVLEFIAPESQAHIQRDVKDIAKGHDGYLGRYRAVSATGMRVFIEGIGKSITYDGKNAILISLRDIPGQTGADSSRGMGSKVIRRDPFDPSRAENLLDYIIVYGQDGVILYVNPAVAKILGYPAEAMAGTPLLAYIAEDSHEKVSASMATSQEQDEVPLCEIALLTRNGLQRSVIVKGKPVEYYATPATLLFLIDITQRKALEDQLAARAQELTRVSTALQQANKQLTLLSTITRHDINNQLTVPMGFLSLLEPVQSDPLLADYCKKALTAAERISAMIRFAKEYEKIGTQAPDWQDLNVAVAAAAKEAPLGNVTIRNDLPAGREVLADPLIVKVLYNLMDNAVRYGGKITTIRFFVEEKGNDLVLLCEDDGDGVAREEKERIFERGFGKNTGLGLAISREILALTGITIRETGVPGRGARFEIAVPKGSWRIAPGH